MNSIQKGTFVPAIIAALAIATLPAARANSGAERLPLGSHCGLIDFADDLLSDHVVQSTDLGRLSSAALQVIADPAKSSIILAARELTRDASIQTLESAVAALKDAGDSAYAMMAKVNGNLFRVVLHYPGDNAVGLVFPQNSSTPVAEIQDSDVVCRKSAKAALATSTVPASSGSANDVQLGPNEGKAGTYSRVINGKIESSQASCKVRKDSAVQAIEFEANDNFWNGAPNFLYANATATAVAGGTRYQVQRSGKRPGGSICGKFDSVVGSVTETLLVTTSSIEHHETYRCLVSGRFESVARCDYSKGQIQSEGREQLELLKKIKMLYAAATDKASVLSKAKELQLVPESATTTSFYSDLVEANDPRDTGRTAKLKELLQSMSASASQDPDGTISEKILEGWNFAKLLQEDPRSPGRYPYLHAGFSDGLHELLGYSEPNSIKLLDLMEVGPNRLKVVYVHTPDKSWLYDHEFIRYCDIAQDNCLERVVDARNKMATHNHSVVTKRVVGYTEGDEKFAIVFSCRSGSLKDLVAGDNSWTVGDLKKRVSFSFSTVDASSGSQADELLEELQGINYRIQVYRSGNLLRGSLFTNTIAAKLGSFTGFQDFPAKLRTAVTAHCKGTCRILDESSASGLFSIRVQDQ